MPQTGKRVWKYALPWGDEVELALPAGATVLHAEALRGVTSEICLWALVDPEAPTVLRRFRLAGTGHPIEGDVRHVSTLVQHGGALVFHLFELFEVRS